MFFSEREETNKTIRQQLLKAQSRANNTQTTIEVRIFEIQYWVLLKQQPYKQSSIRQSGRSKLSPCYYGPFQVKQKIENVAYKLRLSAKPQESISSFIYLNSKDTLQAHQ